MDALICAWDPRGELAEGELVDARDARAPLARLAGAVLLPVRVPLLARSPVGGWVRRAWGRGARLDRMQSVRACPMLLWVAPEATRLHWAARLVPTRAGPGPSGSLRLGAAPDPTGAFSGGLVSQTSAVDLEEVGPPDARGGWTVSGSSPIRVLTEGYFSPCLLAQADGLAVLWTAASLAGEG